MLNNEEVECDNLDWSEPRKCPNCGGDVHEHFGDENYDGDYWTWAHCHKCRERFSSYEFYYTLKGANQ